MSFKANTPKHKLPREKLIELGPSNLTDAELYAIILRTGSKEKNVIQLAKEVSKLNNNFDLSYIDFLKIKALGPVKSTILTALNELSKRNYEDKTKEIPILDNIDKVLQQLQKYRNKNREYLVGLYLNARNGLIKKHIISIGTLNSAMVHPREVFLPAFDIKNPACSLIIAHNHPSGDCNPSLEDISITQKLLEASTYLGIELKDSLIITKRDHYSILKDVI